MTFHFSTEETSKFCGQSCLTLVPEKGQRHSLTWAYVDSAKLSGFVCPLLSPQRIAHLSPAPSGLYSWTEDGLFPMLDVSLCLDGYVTILGNFRGSCCELGEPEHQCTLWGQRPYPQVRSVVPYANWCDYLIKDQGSLDLPDFSTVYTSCM